MQKLFRRRPSASMIIAIVALVFATSGTAVAMTKLVSGDQLIKKHSLSGNRLRNHTITAKQINKSKLGVVPSANDANFATDAGLASDATNASNATNATNAATAANLAGLTRFKTTIAPGGNSFGNAATVTLATDGPLSLVGMCYSSGGTITGSDFLLSSVAGHWTAYDNSTETHDNALVPGTPEDAQEYDASATPPAKDFEGPWDGTFAAITDSTSNYITGLSSVGINLNNSGGCTFAGYAIAS